MLERFRRLLARGASAKVAAGDEHIALFHRSGERRLDRFHAMPRDLVDAVLHVAPGRDDIGVDVVAEDPGSHCSMLRGSVMRPVTADAATVYGDAKYTCADAAPMRPLKFRAVVEMATVCSPSWCP